MELTITAHEKQAEALAILTQDNGVDELLYGGAKNGGKSYLGVTWVVGSALLYPGTRWFIARKELNDLRKHTTPTIYEFLRNNNLDPEAVIKRFNGQDNYFEFFNGSTVFLIDCRYLPQDELYERFGSMQFTGGWIEEGGEVPFNAYENIKLSIGRWLNDKYGLAPKLLITCNPKKNWMYTDFYKPWKEGKLESNKRFIQALVTDNVFRQSNALKVLNNIKDKTTRMRLRYGQWEYVDDPACLMDYDSITSIFVNDHVKKTGRRYMTVDVARYGKDTTRIRIWDGWVVIAKAVYKKLSTVEVAEKVKELQLKYSVPVGNTVIDEDGVGGGVVDMVKGCRGFVANSSPLNPKKGESYSNLKTQCAYKLAEKVNAMSVYEPERKPEAQEVLIEDLEQIKEKNVDKEGAKRMLVSKEEVKQVIGRSPDDGDTYIMRAYFELLVSNLRVA
jgi:phage terminase large subunit